MQIEELLTLEPVLWGRCDNCHGLGHDRWSQNARASAIGGDRNTYAKAIDPLYEHILRCCRDLYLEAARQFKRHCASGFDAAITAA